MTKPPYPVDLGNITECIELFMSRAGQLDETGLSHISTPGRRLAWVQEEVQELIDAMGKGKIADTDDALIDIAWQVLGWLYKRRGIDVARAQIREVNRANIDKVEPIENMVFYPDDPTKVGKPENWTPPDHETILDQAGLEY